jgi:tRNA threonylcarbamoyladenosine biosynthesis protein TsaB
VRILGVDATTEACSAALCIGDSLIARLEEPGRGHAERILDMVDEVLAEAGIPITSLDGIAAGIGPGAFTGVRITVAVAQGLAFGAALPVVAVSSLEALAFQVIQHGAARALACLDARMAEVYWGCYAADPGRGLIATAGPGVGAPAGVSLPLDATSPGGAYRGVGRGFAAYPELSQLPGLTVDPRDRRALPDAREIARLGVLRLPLGEGLDPAALMPLYLRENVALTEAQRRVR